jgi:hypothetical protein
MQTHQATQEGNVELNIGGYRFQTSVQTLRRLPHTFFDAYFSGRYAQDACDDGSIFVDRDGEHFGHVLEYMRHGVVSVAEEGACPSVSLLRLLKREFGSYCMELVVEEEAEPERPEMAYVMGGRGGIGTSFCELSSMERYDATSGQWSAAAAMDTVRTSFGACMVAGELYVIGGMGAVNNRLSSVEKYTPSSDTWSSTAPLPSVRAHHAAIAVGSAIYVLGGFDGDVATASVLKFDSTQGKWSEGAPMPAAAVRAAPAAYAIGNDIHVLGRFSGGEAQAAEWNTLAPMPHGTCGPSASLLGGLVYIVGAGDSCREMLRFDPVSGAWSTLAPTLNRRSGGASFVLGGHLYAVGGAGYPDRENSSVDTMWSATRGRPWRTFTSVVHSLMSSPSSPLERTRSKISSTGLSPQPPVDASNELLPGRL